MPSLEPLLVLVPGSFNHASVYTPLISQYASLHRPVRTIDLRTVGRKPGPPPTMYDDAAFINAELQRLADEGHDIVLVGHSYGGIPVSESMREVTKGERERAGKKGGVVRVGYMTALVPEVGVALNGMFEESVGSGSINVDENGWMFHQDPALTAKYVFNQLPPAEGTKWAKKFSQHSAVSFTNELKYAGYKDVPVSYLFCEEDLCVLPATQQKGIDTIEKVSGQKVNVTRIKSDHCPNVSHPEEVIDWFVSMVEKGADAC